MIPYIDMHCDTLMKGYLSKAENIICQPDFMVDINRLRVGGSRAQVFAIFMLKDETIRQLGDAYPGDRAYIEALLQLYRRTIQVSDHVAEMTSLADYERNLSAGKISGILSLEDGRPVDGVPENLDWLYGEGIRMIALTWNHENCFGYPNSTNPEVMQKGLKDFGIEAVKRMNELGILVDVSHLSDGGFWDVVRVSEKPFVASHSNCRALSPHSRNMTDEMIRALADKGGVMGLNFYGAFLNADGAGQESRIERMILHLQHIVNVGGIETAAIGTDFDGISGTLEIGDCGQMARLFEAMERTGFTIGQIEKIAHQNVERVLKDVLK